MEVTPYASKPLSSCQGSWDGAALIEVTMKGERRRDAKWEFVFVLFIFILDETLPFRSHFSPVLISSLFSFMSPVVSLRSPPRSASAQGALAASPFEF